MLIRGNHDPREFSETTKQLFLEITNLKEILDQGRNVVMCHYPIPFFRGGSRSSAYMLYGHVHQTREYEYLVELRKKVRSDDSGRGTSNGQFINMGCMMPYMDYTPRTLDEILRGDEEYWKPCSLCPT